MAKSKNGSEGDVEGLFKLPLADFTNARNALAAQLKKNGRGDEAADVKALGKPSVSAWAVNQLYWNHREAFDKLIASGERFHKAQSARGGAKVGDMRAALDARRVALTKLSELATGVLRQAGHNPSPDTIHRITTTLEGISSYASRDDGPEPGRLTHDVDPPGFESFGSFVPVKQEAAGRRQAAAGRKQEAGAEAGKQKAEGRKQKAGTEERKSEEANKAKLDAAKALLQDAKKSLTEAQARVRSLEAAKTRAQAEVRQAEERLKEGTKRARSVEEDLKNAGREVAEAERRVAKATSELDKL